MPETDPTEFVHQTMPLCKTLGITAQEFTNELVQLSLAWTPELCTTGGLLHGGAIMALADSAGGACAFLNLPDEASGTATIESKTNFFRGAREGVIVARCRPLHIGSATIVVETEVTNHDRMIAKVVQTQIVLRPQAG